MKRIIPLLVVFLITGCANRAIRLFDGDKISHSTNSVSTAAIVPTAPHARVVSFMVARKPFTNTFDLTWAASADAVSYRLHYGTNSGVYTSIINFGNVTQAVVMIITPTPARFFFVLTAVDAFGTESDFSNERHWPAYLPIMIGLHLSWPAQFPVTVEQCLNFKWDGYLSNVVGQCDVKLQSRDGFHGYRLNQPTGTDPVSISSTPIMFYPK